MRQFFLILCALCAFGVQAQDKSVAIFNSVGKDVDAGVADAVRDVLQEGVVKSGKYKDVFEREQIEQAQKELVFQANATDGDLSQMAAAEGADYSCFASITKIGVNYQVSCKIVEAGLNYKVSFMNSWRTKQTDPALVMRDIMDVLDAIATELFQSEGGIASGRSGIATADLTKMGICDDCEKYEIAISDEEPATWEEAVNVCKCKGDGWSLPSDKELERIWKDRLSISEQGIRKFKQKDYWSSKSRNNYESFSVDFKTVKPVFYSKLEKNVFRCIKKEE